MANLVAVWEERLADVETPVSAYVKLCGGQTDTFLFESGEAVESIGRYSIVAWDPLARLSLGCEGVRVRDNGNSRDLPARDFFGQARRMQEELSCDGLPELPFVGGLMGYVGFDAVRLIEPILGAIPRQDLPVAELAFPSRFVVFDHFFRKMVLVAIERDEATARAKLKEIGGRLSAPLYLKPRKATVQVTPPTAGSYQGAVARAKEYINAGDIFQVVLSEQFRGKTEMDPLSVYRWLRVKSPSPYMFYLNLAGQRLVGASPETQVRMDRGLVSIRPIAGTRPRGRDEAGDQVLAKELLADEKERAEHIMLVDLARNDVGRVADYGSVAVEPYMIVERFSHVMHITSQVNGRLRHELSAWDAFTASFPAGTVSGAPKVRAMQIIDELETKPRGAYAGAVGCFGPSASLDTCIGIRMISFVGDEFVLQAGAGIVADSDPEKEFQEINHKAAQSLAALKAAAEGTL